MLKLLAITLLLSSSLFSDSTDKLVVDYLEKAFKNNKSIIKLKVNVAEKLPIKDMKDWNAYILKVVATVKTKKGNRDVSQKMIWFSNGTVIAPDLIDLDTDLSLKELVTPSFLDEYYKKENLIYGNKNAAHKIAIFSDPLCPFCRKFVPGAIEEMKKYPNKFAIYYYHFPLEGLHPAAIYLTKAAIAAELKGYKDVVLKMYNIAVNPREKDVNKILTAFNKVMGTKLKPADLKDRKVLKHFENDVKIADDVMVEGTPTLFFDGKKDKSKRKYKKVI